MRSYDPHCPTCMNRQSENKAAQAVLNAWEYSFWLSVKDNCTLSVKQTAKYQKIRQKLDINDEIAQANFRIGKLNTQLAALMGDS